MAPRTTFDPRLYFVVGPEDTVHSLADIVTKAILGGATLVQYRSKRGETRTQIEEASQIKYQLQSTDVAFLVNDRVDVALAVGADGVHIGQNDMPAKIARAKLGDDAILGLTVRSVNEAISAPLDLVDYVSIGGVFDTKSKVNVDTPIGVQGLISIVNLLRRRGATKIIAIAGIRESNVGIVMQSGVDGVAVVSAIAAAGDPVAVARTLRTKIDAVIKQR